MQWKYVYFHTNAVRIHRKRRVNRVTSAQQCVTACQWCICTDVVRHRCALKLLGAYHHISPNIMKIIHTCDILFTSPFLKCFQTFSVNLLYVNSASCHVCTCIHSFSVFSPSSNCDNLIKNDSFWTQMTQKSCQNIQKLALTSQEGRSNVSLSCCHSCLSSCGVYSIYWWPKRNIRYSLKISQIYTRRVLW